MSDYKTINQIREILGCSWHRVRSICENLPSKKGNIGGREFDVYPYQEVKRLFDEREALPRTPPLGTMKTRWLADKHWYSTAVVALITRDEDMPAPAGYMLNESNLTLVPYYVEETFMAWVKSKYPTKQPNFDQVKLAHKKAKKVKPVIKPVDPVKVKYKNPLAFFDIVRGM